MRLGIVIHGHRPDAMAAAHHAVAQLASCGAQVLVEDEVLAAFASGSVTSLNAPGCAGGCDSVAGRRRHAASRRTVCAFVGCGAARREPGARRIFGGRRGRCPAEAVGQGHPRRLRDRAPRSAVRADEWAKLVRHQRRGDEPRRLCAADYGYGAGGWRTRPGHYIADGLVVATPTGSTGYSLSAGGPIISPKVDCMVLTPICAHSLQHRPTVVQGSAQIRLLLGSDAPQSACLQVDGQTYAQLDDGAVVEISRADRTLQLIRTSDQPFFNLVREKLTEWTR